MSIEQTVMERVRQLPRDKQREVLDFADFLSCRALPIRPRKSLKGLCADLSSKPLSSEEIDAARREMWCLFRENIE